jgi:hypothetical protein|tara:strand:- start:564 stop:773 length:210 start_codon:yes stop_codon:yes gene_type:complete
MNIITQTDKRATVFYKGKHFVVSDNGAETLIFPSDSAGNISNYLDVGGALNTTLTEVLADFSQYIRGGY